MRTELLLLFLVVGAGNYLMRFLPLLWALRSGSTGEGSETAAAVRGAVCRRGTAGDLDTPRDPGWNRASPPRSRPLAHTLHRRALRQPGAHGPSRGISILVGLPPDLNPNRCVALVG